uniref:NADPH-dependent FMN reductase-like domain-containing protein n=1 Tax=Ditylenchus dipsaci TaxID=166011 RepID=A0A915DLW8_9BILA
MHQTSSESSFKTELIDLNDWHLPMNDEPHVPATGKYTQEHTKKWSQKITAADGFIFVTPEYNHGYPAALKNALDHLFQEWGNKPAAVVSYGGSGGTKSAGQLKQVFELMQMRLADTWPAIKLPRSVFETGKISDPNKDLMEYMKDVRTMANQIANLLK